MKTILSIIFFSASIAIVMIFTIPQYMCDSTTCSYDGIKKLRVDITEYSKAMNSAKDLESRRSSLVERYNSISADDRQRLENMLPNNVDNIKLVLELETIAKKYGLVIESPKLETKIETVKVDAPTNSQGQAIRSDNSGSVSLPYGTFTLDFTVRSNYENVKKLISDVEQNLRLIEPVALTIKVPGINETTVNGKTTVYPDGVYDVTMRAIIYYLKN